MIQCLSGFRLLCASIVHRHAQRCSILGVIYTHFATRCHHVQGTAMCQKTQLFGYLWLVVSCYEGS